jgi:hypothetical protein
VCLFLNNGTTMIEKLYVLIFDCGLWIVNYCLKSAYAQHILSNIHEYGPMEMTMTLLQTTRKGKRMNTLENYYIQHFYHNYAIIQEQIHTGSKLLFQLINDAQSRISTHSFLTF